MKRRKEHLALGASTFSVKVQQNLNKNEDTQNKAAKRETVMMATMEMKNITTITITMKISITTCTLSNTQETQTQQELHSLKLVEEHERGEDSINIHQMNLYRYFFLVTK